MKEITESRNAFLVRQGFLTVAPKTLVTKEPYKVLWSGLPRRSPFDKNFAVNNFSISPETIEPQDFQKLVRVQNRPFKK